MKLAAGINFDASGIAQSINAMQMEMDIMGIFGENVVGFDKVGYQRKEPVISSFAEYIGTNALSHSTDEQVGRISNTQKPLDFALSDSGYFQVKNQDGSLELTRDGRFKLDKDGKLLTQLNQEVLSSSGSPIVLPFIPDRLDHIKVGLDGKIGVFDNQKRDFVPVTYLGVVSADGKLTNANCVRQGYVESSNVQLEKEYIEMVNYKNNFTANRQMFIMQNSNLTQAIQTLGRV